ncbi:MAG TPA: hypothetical protein VK891_16590 [Euzebyales bacterium]|nr:hypothetical protein [Euzebyales bacterium]
MAPPTPRTLDISEAFRAGWRGFLANILPLIVVALLVWVVTGYLNFWAERTGGFIQFVLGLLAFFVGQVVAIVWISLALAVVDGQPITTDTLLPSGATLISYIIASLLFSLMLGIGLVLLIIPGIIIAVTFGLFGWALVDKALDPIEALRHSSRITSGHRWQLFGFLLLAILLNIGGVLLLVVGVLVTSAVTLIAAGHIYRQLDGSLQSVV